MARTSGCPANSCVAMVISVYNVFIFCFVEFRVCKYVVTELRGCSWICCVDPYQTVSLWSKKQYDRDLLWWSTSQRIKDMTSIFKLSLFYVTQIRYFSHKCAYTCLYRFYRFPVFTIFNYLLLFIVPHITTRPQRNCTHSCQ